MIICKGTGFALFAVLCGVCDLSLLFIAELVPFCLFATANLFCPVDEFVVSLLCCRLCALADYDDDDDDDDDVAFTDDAVCACACVCVCVCVCVCLCVCVCVTSVRPSV